MASQKTAVVALGGFVLAVVGVGLWFALMGDPGEADPEPDGAEVATGSEETGPKAGTSTAKTKRGQKSKGEAALFGLVKFKKGETPAAAQPVVLTAKDGEPWTVSTDENGAFRFDELPRGGPYELTVQADKFATIRLPGIGLDRREERDAGTLWLDAAVSQTVIVKDYKDQPLEGADVQAFAAPSGNVDWQKRMAQIGVAPVAVETLTTDAEGKVTFPELATGAWSFVATKKGFARTSSGQRGLSSKKESKPLTVYLGSGFQLAGHVLDRDGNGISEALVMAGPNTGYWGASAAPGFSRAEADEQGSYAFDGLPSGDVQLWAARPGGVPTKLATLRVPNVKEYDIRLIAGGVLKGKVTLEADGTAVAEATVRATGWSRGSQRITEAVTDAEGNYVIDTLLEGSINALNVEKSGLVQVLEIQQGGWQQIPINRDDTIVRDLQMTTAASLTGVVSGPDGPLEGARVNLYSMRPGNQGWDNKNATTDGKGVYSFDGLREGKALLQVSKSGFHQKNFPQNYWMALQQGNPPEEFTAEVPAEGEATKDLVLVAGVVVKGRVEMADNSAPTDTTVNVGGKSADAADDGTFSVEGVTPGPKVWVTASKEGYAAEIQYVAVLEDVPTEDVLVTLSKTGVVRGTIASAYSAELRDAYVQLLPYKKPNRQNQWEMQQAMQRWQSAKRAPVLADGTYEVKMPYASGKFQVRATALGHESATSAAVDVVPGQESYQVDLNLPEGGRLHGRVIVKATAEGVPGAEVTLTSSGGGRRGDMMMVQSSISYGGNDTPLVIAMTRSDGTFEVPNLPAGGYRASAKAEGYVDGQKSFKFPDESEVDVVIEPSLEITGFVRLGDGAPVSGVTISAQSADGGATQNPGMPNGFPGGGGTNSTTGTDGGFRVANLKSGNYKLLVSVPWNSRVNVRNHTSDPVAAGSTDVKVSVQAGLTIKGKIVGPEDKPIVGLWINASPQTPGPGNQWRNAQSGKDGSFELMGLSEGTYNVTINTGWGTGTDYVGATREGVNAGEQNLQFKLEKGLTIEGIARDAAGKPAPNLQLWVQPLPDPNKPRHNMSYRQSSTDGEGKFEVKGLAPGNYRITMQPGWNNGQSADGNVLSGGEKVAAGARSVQLALSAGLAIEGVVVDESGSPMAKTNVWANPKGGGNGASARTDENGRFKIKSLLPRTAYTVQANRQGLKQVVLNDVQSGTTGLRLVMERGMEIKGILRDPGGSPLVQVFLQFTTEDNKSRGHVNTGADGTFTVGGLDEAEYNVKAYRRKMNDDGTPGRGGDWVDIGSVTAPSDDVTLTLTD